MALAVSPTFARFIGLGRCVMCSNAPIVQHREISSTIRLSMLLVFFRDCLTLPFSPLPEKDHYKLVIVGGGAAGATMSNKFASKLGKNRVAIIEPADVSHILSISWVVFKIDNIL